MDEVTKTKIDNLISLRQLTMQVLVIIGGGLVGISFMADSFLKYLWILVGAYLFITSCKDYIKISAELKEYLYKRNDGD